MNLFYASTPYQMLLCFMIALSDCSEMQNFMLLNSNDLDMRDSYQLFDKLFPDVFLKNLCLKSSDSHNNIKRFFLQKKNVKTIKNVVDEILPIDRFYYSSDWKVDVSYISHLLKNTETQFYYFEDGIATYISNRVDPKNIVERLGDKLLFGWWRKETAIEGLLNKDAQIYAVHPNLLPEVFASNIKHKIDNKKFLTELDMTGVPEEIKKYLNSGINMLITLPRSALMNDTYTAMIKDIVVKANKENMKVAIKRHPRDLNDDSVTNKLKNAGQFVELPVGYPIEVYYLLFYNTLKHIVGLIGTAVLTAKWLFPDIRITVPYTKELIASDKIALSFRLYNKLKIELKEMVR